MRVTLAQIPVDDKDISKNLSELKLAVTQSAEEKSDILLTPEGCLSGYTHLFDSVQLDKALDELEAFAREKRIGLALGTCKLERDGLFYNELRFYNKEGVFLGCHTKTLRCGEGEPVQGEINYYSVKPLRTFDFCGITIGGLICNDMWANPGCTPMPDPHLTRMLSKMGARIIFHAVNGGRSGSELSQGLVKRFHETHVLMKAMADNMIICTVDNAFPLELGVSSIGGIACPDAKWRYTLPDVGRQVSTFEIALG